MTIEEILDRVCEPDACGCWPWVNPTENGHGRVMGRNAHCVVYEIFGYEIPDGFLLDHLCLFKACVNPAHMEPVTLAENTRRHFKHCFEVSI
jgi:hypothetical protein